MEEIVQLRENRRPQDAYRKLLLIYDDSDPQMLEEMAIVGYYNDDHNRARLAIDKMCFHQLGKWWHAKSLLRWYLVDLSSKKLTLPDSVLAKHIWHHDDRNQFVEHYISSSPSIIKTATGYLVNVRYVNYFVLDGLYSIANEKNSVRTLNTMVYLDKEFEVVRVEDLLDTSREKYDNIIQGLEDLKLIDPTSFVATVLDYKNNERTPKMLCGEINNGEAVNCRVLPGPEADRAEKNWVPIEGSKLVVYGFVQDQNGWSLVVVNPLAPDFVPIKYHQTSNLNFSGLRNSCTFIKYKNGYLTVMHEVTMVDRKRYYLNRLVQFDDKFQMTHLSHCLKLTERNISFVLGLCHSHNKDDVIIGFSIMDRTTNFITISTKTIDQLLYPLSKIE